MHWKVTLKDVERFTSLTFFLFCHDSGSNLAMVARSFFSFVREFRLHFRGKLGPLFNPTTFVSFRPLWQTFRGNFPRKFSKFFFPLLSEEQGVKFGQEFHAKELSHTVNSPKISGEYKGLVSLVLC